MRAGPVIVRYTDGRSPFADDECSMSLTDGGRPRRGAGIVAVFAAAWLVGLSAAEAQTVPLGDLAVGIQEFAPLPHTGGTPGSSLTAYIARVNFLREDPANPNRLFVNDLNGPLYILDRTTLEYTRYLDFRPGEPPLVDPTHGNTLGPTPTTLDDNYSNFTTAGGWANGFVTFEFHPEYAIEGSPFYGTFYTVHIEMPHTLGPGQAPVLNPGDPVGPSSGRRHAVLTEWIDSDPTSTVFEGTAREVLRLAHYRQIHPLGDLLFNPNAGPGHADYGMLYLAVGDGGTGEINGSTPSQVTAINALPQNLASPAGKVLRIDPAGDDGLDGRYGIPGDNPFVGQPGALGELWASGFRNVHRLSWDVESDRLIANDIGQSGWEEVNIVEKGGNYGYAFREGTDWFRNRNDGNVSAPSDSDGFIYPAAQYPHAGNNTYGAAAIASGFVYRGVRIPELQGMYIFGDIPTGRLYYADYDEMLAAHAGSWNEQAQVYELKIFADGEQLEPLHGLHQLIEDKFNERHGTTGSLLPNQQRADIRLAMDASGELYLLSKSDGMIRALVSPHLPLPGDVNGDGVVDIHDYNIIRDNFNLTGAARSHGDLNGDGVVDLDDFRIWKSHRTDLAGAGKAALGSETAVPEPTAGGLVALLLALLAVAGRFRQR